ncbi:hypothetical protein B0H17DRAFT_1149012 [Mycena rosella]|uniref:Uncharacterized protein n=1 Tax=Mycena rosella TaxID=1033263 RepID=A0AAD7C6A1_MYCRO|nr:hypothetical protein B0H17DRAFT_1149012 [Mycena rosella]
METVGALCNKSDKTHFESRCRACVSHRAEKLREADEREVNSGIREYTRSPTELQAQALEGVTPVEAPGSSTKGLSGNFPEFPLKKPLFGVIWGLKKPLSDKGGHDSRYLQCDLDPEVRVFFFESWVLRVADQNSAQNWLKSHFADKAGQILALKSHNLDKENANFRPEKATFPDHPLVELPGASPLPAKSSAWRTISFDVLTSDVRALTQTAAKKENTTSIRLSQNQQIARSTVLGRQRLIRIHIIHIQLLIPTPQDEFAEDLCKLFVACNVAWNSAANPQLLLFFTKYVPEAKIPDRRVLSGYGGRYWTKPNETKVRFMKCCVGVTSPDFIPDYAVHVSGVIPARPTLSPPAYCLPPLLGLCWGGVHSQRTSEVNKTPEIATANQSLSPVNGRPHPTANAFAETLIWHIWLNETLGTLFYVIFALNLGASQSSTTAGIHTVAHVAPNHAGQTTKPNVFLNNPFATATSTNTPSSQLRPPSFRFPEFQFSDDQPTIQNPYPSSSSLPSPVAAFMPTAKAITTFIPPFHDSSTVQEQRHSSIARMNQAKAALSPRQSGAIQSTSQKASNRFNTPSTNILDLYAPFYRATLCPLPLGAEADEAHICP